MEVISWQKEKAKDVAANCSLFISKADKKMQGGIKMGMTCPIGGCNSTIMCKHKKMMLAGMIILAILVVVLLLR